MLRLELMHVALTKHSELGVVFDFDDSRFVQLLKTDKDKAWLFGSMPARAFMIQKHYRSDRRI